VGLVKAPAVEAAYFIAGCVLILLFGGFMLVVFTVQPIIAAAWFDFLAWLLPGI
jgi:hypothetical protein